jgi:5-methylcytosine-specific restriction endonuclease McrA
LIDRRPAELARSRRRNAKHRRETMPVFNSRQARTRWIRRVRSKLLSTEGTCFYCGGELTPEWATLDHVEPRSRGGPDEEWNVVLACRRDNFRKGSRSIESCVCQLRRGAGLFAFHDAVRRGLVTSEELLHEVSKVE